MFRIKEITALKQKSLNLYGTLRFINERKIYGLCSLIKSWNGQNCADNRQLYVSGTVRIVQITDNYT